MPQTRGWIEVKFTTLRDRILVTWWVVTGQSFRINLDTAKITYKVMP